MRAAQPVIPPGHIREVEHYDLSLDYRVLMWSVLWRDPASGRSSQELVTGRVHALDPPDSVSFLRQTAREALSRCINQKCGVRRARFLSQPLPRTCKGGFV